MQMSNFINVDSCLFDQSLIAKEVSNYGDPHASSINQKSTSSAILQSERSKYEIFIQLVTQCFQLCIRMKEDD